MKIIEESPTKLVLKDSGAVIMGIGGIAVLVSVAIGIATAPWASASVFQALLFPAFFLLVGLICLLTARTRTTTLDKSTDSALFTVSGIIGNSQTEKKVSDIARVEMREEYVQNTSNGRTSTEDKYRLVFILRDGTEIFIDRMHEQKASLGELALSAVNVTGTSREKAKGEKIAAFLGIPFQSSAPSLGGAGINLGGIQL
jgi:hypothetical protein